MKNDLDLFEDREKDWLAKEIQRENSLVTEFDINDARKLKMEHHHKHYDSKPVVKQNGKLGAILFFIFIFVFVFIVFVFMALVRSFY